MIPPSGNAEFVAAMERVLDVYHRPLNAALPVVCMDETPRQLIRETRKPLPARPGSPQRFDYEYERCGTCVVFMASEPLAGKRFTRVSERRTKIDWAHFLENISEQYPHAEKITLVMDNLNSHTPGALYQAYPPEQAKALYDRFEFVHTPKHGSWLNVAEIELNVLVRQCLNRRIDDQDELASEVLAWQAHRDQLQAKVNWQFTTADARIKLKRLYPTLDRDMVAKRCHSVVARLAGGFQSACSAGDSLVCSPLGVGGPGSARHTTRRRDLPRGALAHQQEGAAVRSGGDHSRCSGHLLARPAGASRLPSDGHLAFLATGFDIPILQCLTRNGA